MKNTQDNSGYFGHRSSKSESCSFASIQDQKERSLLDPPKTAVPASYIRPSSFSSKMPTILNGESLPARSSGKYKTTKLSLSNLVQLLPLEHINDSLLHTMLIIDTRPFQEYCKSHIINSVNICLPSTLSRRSTFTLEKCIQTLQSDEKIIFAEHFARDMQNVLFYDSRSNIEEDISPAIYYLIEKFQKSTKWNSNLFVLKSGFSDFAAKYQDLCVGCSPLKNNTESDTSNTSVHTTHTETFSPPVGQFASPQSTSSPIHQSTSIKQPPLKLQMPASIINSNHSNKSSVLPSLARFTLPDVSSMPFFKSRHNEEVFTARPDATLHLHTNISPGFENELPDWIREVYGEDWGATILSKKFNELQIEEKERLNTALGMSHYELVSNNLNFKYNTNSKLESIKEKIPVLSSGFELGSKNRYKDIYPYEHARVKLLPYESDKSTPVEGRNWDNHSTYVNASYIHYPPSKLHYIATQGPLSETVGDFWKVVIDHRVPLIFSLTPQLENKIEKCAPFWLEGTYYSNGIEITVKLIEELIDVDLSPNGEHHSKSFLTETTFRHLEIKIEGLKPLHTLQVHMMGWPDHGIVGNSEGILGLVAFKSYIMNQLNIKADVEKSRQVVVHCSAGCGRTGCFCCIDTAIDRLNSSDSPYDDLLLTPAAEFAKPLQTYDIIYDITASFRTQRVSMVQNLRQYILIYDTVLKYLKNKKTLKNLSGGKFTEDGLVDWENKGKEEGEMIGRFLKSWEE